MHKPIGGRREGNGGNSDYSMNSGTTLTGMKPAS